MKYKHVSFLAATLLFVSPFIASAQTESTGLVDNLFSFALSVINDYLVPLIFAVAFVIFLFRVYQLFIQGGTSPDSSKKGRQFVMVSLVGFFLMFSVWGLINLLINTLGFDSASMPAIPTFGTANSSVSSGSSGMFGGLFGGSNSNSSSYGTTNVNGTTLDNVVPAANGTCPGGYTLSGSSCYLNANSNNSGTANSSNSSNNSSNGSSGAAGSECTNNTQCGDGLACNDATQTCQTDNASNFNCKDDSTPNSQGLCADGSSPTNSTGAEAPEDGTVAQGGSCAGNEDACASGTCDADGICADEDSGNSTSGGVTQCDYGSVSGGANCVLCADGSATADSAADCPGGGYTGDDNGGDANNNAINSEQDTGSDDGDGN